MEHNLYQIGEFAAMNKVSARMLRHYDKIGLFRPNCILENGYRCYSEQQIAVISQIKMLRGCGFLLDEIAEILKIDNPVFLKEQVKKKAEELECQSAIQQASVHLLNKLMQDNVPGSPEGAYGISIVTKPETRLLVSNSMVSFDRVEEAFDRLLYFIEKKKLCASGLLMLRSGFGGDEEDKSQVAISVSEEYRGRQYETIRLPQASALTTIHYGDYYDIGYAYSSIMKYAVHHGYLLDEPFMERYFIDSAMTANPSEYVTEISVFIKHTP